LRVGISDLAVDQLEEIIVTEDSLIVHGNEEGLGEVHGGITLGKLVQVSASLGQE
jgi:hypothetical protein